MIALNQALSTPLCASRRLSEKTSPMIRSSVIATALALALAAAAPARAEDLLQVYREAQLNDPTLAAARANWEATQERLPQARAGLLPNVSLPRRHERQLLRHEHRQRSARRSIDRNFGLGRPDGVARRSRSTACRTRSRTSQAEQQVEQADYTLVVRAAGPDPARGQAYFDVLLAQFNVELAESQKAAVSEQLAQAKRNFEVGVATITDTNEAQAKYDSIVAQEISRAQRPREQAHGAARDHRPRSAGR